MSDLNSNTKTTLRPLEGKKTLAPILDNPENIEAKDRAGFFDEISEGFDVCGSINNFNPPATEYFPVQEPNPDRVVSTASDIFKDGGYVVLGSVKKGVGVIGNIFTDTLNAVVDGVKENVIFETPKEQNPIDQQKQAEEQKKAIDNQYKTQFQQHTEDDQMSLRRKQDAIAKLQAKSEQIAKEANMQWSYNGVISAITGETRIDLQAPVENKAKELAKIRAMATKGPVTGASRKGGQGFLEANKAGETTGGNSNAQNAVG